MPSEPVRRHDVVCPFCGLACDDLTIERDDGGLRIIEGGCPLGRQRFEQPSQDGTPRIAGEAATLPSAIARAAEILDGRRLPLFAGLATDVDGVRAVLRLADRIGGVVDHLGSDALFRNVRTVQDAGWIATTLSEVRNHLDLLLIVGSDPSAAFPRFAERCVRPGRTLFPDNPPERSVIRIGPPADDAGAVGSDLGAELLPCATDRLPEVVAMLRALVNERKVAVAGVGGIPLARLSEIAGRLRAAKYGVIAWAAADLDYADADLTVQTLSGLVGDLNRTTRCALLPLTGADNLIGANQACLWQTGWPLRTGFGEAGPAYDPDLYSARRLIERGEADALVWISAFRPVPPPATDIPTVVIATSDTVATRQPEVFIPVGTPGIDHAGRIFRMDSVVSLPLSGLRESPLPTTAGVIAQIDAALAQGSRPR